MAIDTTTTPADYRHPIPIADGIYWVGFYDQPSGLHCNPYLIVDHGEAVVIDGGSRPDFPVVMMKILRAGIAPASISALIYQHYDPDLCGSLANFEEIIDNPELRIISDRENNMFIRHYSVSSKLVALDSVGHRFRFRSGRELRFINTPYAHSAGSFVTLDSHSGVLFTSDLFGSYGSEWELFLRLEPQCRPCLTFPQCPHGKSYCPVADIARFHRRIMPATAALRLAMERIAALPYAILAPQHGSVIPERTDGEAMLSMLCGLDEVGIDGVLTPLRAGRPPLGETPP
ncbi:MAG: MBL fold metallo-hydrolase [Thermodesulfobacteriota bacterium]